MESIEQASGATYRSASSDRKMVRVAAASMAGTAIEAFDFLAYGTAAALVFNKLFFPSLDSATGTLAAFGAFASGLFARPIGGIIFGHFGDRLGRKSILILSLLLMGICTVLIGLLPTYGSIGIWAPILLVALRIGQGASFGGELGGAVLMAVEHAPARLKCFYGSLPQVGAPIGILMSSGAFALMNLLPSDSFMSWGWRIPFLASGALIAVGVFIRMKVDETPDFVAVTSQRKVASMPARDVLVSHWRPLLLAIGGKLAEVTLIYTIIVFSISYATSHLGFSRGNALSAVILGSLCQAVTIPLFGWLGDRVGARRLYIVGTLLLAVMAVPLFSAMESGSLALYTLAAVVALALNYAIIFGPQSSLYAAQFPPELRYSGISIGIQFAAALGGGLAPLIAATLVARYGGIGSVGVYLSVLGVVGAVSAWLMKPTASD
ncbi:MFS transporter [Paraburkholderia susongensis]|uniref:Metabolite-proton symporter n=1 Tax=Paraburkholderia susongensis TaxID=1515439 RepID=A0A1X7LRS5_9BURK|nr:MFS transporter [Paraburkholderia susongensis]SMG56033.1 metabolite-proton symporter [Paraburkholderia susongensis]